MVYEKKKGVLSKKNTQGLSHIGYTAAVDTQGVLQHGPCTPWTWGPLQTPQTVTGSPPLHSDTEQGLSWSRDYHPAWSLQGSAAGSSGRSEGGDGCPLPPARLPASLARSRCACRDAQVSAGCIFLVCVCLRTAGISMSKQGANSDNPAPGAKKP